MASKNGSTIWDMISIYGLAVYVNEEMGVVITANGSYLNLWSGSPESGFTNTDCRSLGKNIMEMQLVEVVNEAEEYFNDIMKEIEDEE